MDITEILLCVLTLISLALSIFLIPNLKAKFTDDQRERIKTYIAVAVQAAEQLYPTLDGEKMGKEKLQYVADYLETKGVTFDVDDVHDEIRLMIESAVLQFTS